MKGVDIINTFSFEEIFKGLSLFAQNYRPDLFEENAFQFISSEKVFLKDEQKLVRMKINSKKFDTIEVEFLCLLPDNGIYSWMGKKYYSPFVLVEKSEEIINRKERKRMDLNDMFVIPGYFFDKVLQIIRAYDFVDNFKENVDLFKYMLSSNLNTVRVGTQLHKVIDGKEKSIYLKIPSLFELDESNPLLVLSNTRKVVYHSRKVAERMRLPDESYSGSLDMLETPESEEIGLSLFLSYGAKYDAKYLKIIPGKESNRDFFSYSTLLVPFLTYNDTPRAMMGGKNLKQTVKVIGNEKPLVKTGIEEEMGFDFGVNAFVGYALFNGFNFEDGIVASRSFSEKMKIEVEEDFFIEDDVPISIDYIVKEIGKTGHKFTIEPKIKEKNAVRVVYEFSNKKRFVHGDSYLTRRVYVINDEKETEEKDLEKRFFFKERYACEFKDVKPQNFEIEDLTPPITNTKEGESFSVSHLKIRVPIRMEKPLEVGDKITGRYGNKGTVSKILDDQDMPYTEIGGQKKYLDLILSPFGIITRMNLGQLIETQGSLVKFTDGNVDCRFSPDKVLSDLKALGSDENGKFPLHMKVGEIEKVFKAVVGYQYFIRLDHCVRDKLHFIGKTKHLSNITFQPYKGRKNDGGQRIGEMEFWTLFDHNAVSLIELFSKTNLSQWKEYDKYLRSFNTLLKAYHNFMIKPFEKDGILFVEKTKNSEENEAIMDLLKGRRDAIDKYKEAKFLISKNGFPRTAMLGRRIHYSGRATIVPATDIDINHVYLPIDFALEWLNLNVENKRSILEGNMEERKKLCETANDYCKLNETMVLLNRQPSLHLHSIQSFYPIFWENYAIGLPIMTCEGFGADFDGDTMAVYYPADQNEKIKKEIKSMLPSFNLFRVGNRELALSLSQDMTYGNYLLKNSNLSEKVKKIILSGNAVTELLDLQKELLNAATSQNLSVSFFEAMNGNGDMKKIEESKARGKDENFKAIHGNFYVDGQDTWNFSKGIPLKFYIGRDLENFDENLASRGRKSMLDKKLHVAEAGYFTRKMVEFLYPLRVTSQDCGTKKGLVFTKSEIEKLDGKYEIDRLINGRYLKFKEKDDWTLVNFDNLNEIKEKIKSGDFNEIILRSPVTCESDSPCMKCCGIDTTKSDKLFDIGTFIGVRAGHSIGERGTQLSMKTFQTGRSNFRMSRISSRIFARKEESYVDYLINLANEDIFSLMGESLGKPEYLLKTIDISSVYLEILFMYMKKQGINKESDVKKYLSDFEKNGFFSSLSFENPPDKEKALDGKKIKHSTIANKFEVIDKPLEEKMPKAVYALLPDKVEVILNAKKDEEPVEKQN